MTTCPTCNQDTKTADGCTATTLTCNGRTYPTFPFGSDPGWPGVVERCVYCDARVGYAHHLGCPVQVCPACDDQLISCDCRFDELADVYDDDDDLDYLDEDDDWPLRTSTPPGPGIIDLATWRRGVAGSRPRVDPHPAGRRTTAPVVPIGRSPATAAPAVAPPTEPAAAPPTDPPNAPAGASTDAPSDEPPVGPDGEALVVIAVDHRDRRRLTARVRVHDRSQPIDPSDWLPFLQLVDGADPQPGARGIHQPVFLGATVDRRHGRLWLYRPAVDRPFGGPLAVDSDGSAFLAEPDRRYREGFRWEPIGTGRLPLFVTGFYDLV